MAAVVAALPCAGYARPQEGRVGAQGVCMSVASCAVALPL